ncbi:MAG: GNAT family N-acetyltransferase [Clostridiales bacterium]|nr:GNAT family N-acetyltransferase [Clostridiales bacterium]
MDFIIREYSHNDLEEIIDLFYNTVHSINVRDYSAAQLNEWANGNIDKDKWNEFFLKNYTLAAEYKGKIIGFGDIDSTGYLDRLFVHKDFQNCKIATEICSRLEAYADTKTIKTASSVTALPFFKKRGYKIIKEQFVIRNNIALKNYLMEKQNIKYYYKNQHNSAY